MSIINLIYSICFFTYKLSIYFPVDLIARVINSDVCFAINSKISHHYINQDNKNYIRSKPISIRHHPCQTLPWGLAIRVYKALLIWDKGSVDFAESMAGRYLFVLFPLLFVTVFSSCKKRFNAGTYFFVN